MLFSQNEDRFKDDTQWDVVQFAFTRRDIVGSALIDIFNSNTITAVSTTAPELAVTGIANYNAFVNGLPINPKMVRRISIISSSDDYLSQNLNIATIDANGQKIIIPKFTSNYIGINQFQNQANIDFGVNELILNGNTYISQYAIYQLTQVKMLIYYKELKLSDMLGANAMGITEYKKRHGFADSKDNELRLQIDDQVNVTRVQLDEILKEAFVNKAV